MPLLRPIEQIQGRVNAPTLIEKLEVRRGVKVFNTIRVVHPDNPTRTAEIAHQVWVDQTHKVFNKANGWAAVGGDDNAAIIATPAPAGGVNPNDADAMRERLAQLEAENAALRNSAAAELPVALSDTIPAVLAGESDEVAVDPVAEAMTRLQEADAARGYSEGKSEGEPAGN